VPLDVLMQGSAERHVDLLAPEADCEDGEVATERLARVEKVRRLLVGVHQGRLRMEGLRPADRIDVRAAREDEAGHAVEPPRRLRLPPREGEDERLAARGENRVDVVPVELVMGIAVVR